jgi:uncharacterized protein (DUF433 family)
MRHLGDMMDIPPEELDAMLAAGLALAESLADSELARREMLNLANTFEDYDALERLAELLGISPEELMHSLQEGQSLAEIAEANGMTPEALVDAIVAEAEAMLDEAVAAGDLDAEQAAAILDFVRQAVEFIVDKPLDFPHAMGFHMGPGLGLHLRDMDWPDFDPGAFTFVDPLTVAAETIGITRGELLQALREGQSLEEIAEAHGVDPQDVREAQNEAIEQALGDLSESFPHLDLDITIEGLEDLPMPPSFFFGKQWGETHGDWEQGHHPWLEHWFNCCPCDETEGGE